MAYKKLAEQTAMPVYFGGDEVPGLKYKARAEQTAVPIYLVNEQGEYVDGTTPGTGTVTRAALAPEVAAAVDRSLIGAGMIAALSEGASSTGVQLLGDSTGNQVGEWPNLLSQAIADHYPAYEVREYYYDAGADLMASAPNIVRASTDPRRVQFTATGNQTPSAPKAAITTDLDVRARISPDSWTNPTPQILVAQFGSSGLRGFRFSLVGGANATVTLDWSADGTNIQTAAASTAIPKTAGIWVRATLDVDNGASGHTITFYYSTDGGTWTQAGTTTRAGTTSVYNADYTFELAGRGGSEQFAGALYEVQVRNGINGSCVTPCLPEFWKPTSLTPAPTGMPVFTFVNGSIAGADLAFLGTSPRPAQMTPDYGQNLTFISSSHNELVVNAPWLAVIQGYLTTLQARMPAASVCLLTQNPRLAPAARPAAQATRRANDLEFARILGVSAIDTYGAFIADGRPLTDLVLTDGIHPSDAGSRLWANAVKAALGIA